MPKSNTWGADALKLIFQNTAAALIGDSSGLQPSATAGSLYVSLHTADPGPAGDQTTDEITYTGPYARVAVARSSAGWTESGTNPEQVANAALIAFPACTGSSAAAAYFGVGTAATGAGKLLYSGALSGSGLAISAGITPQFAIGDLVITEA